MFDKIVKGIRDIFKRNEFIALHEPVFNGKERDYVFDAIDSTFVSSVGGYVDRVEEQLSEITHTEKAAVVVNGTAALQVALRVIGVKQGEEVLTQGLTFVATSNAIVYNGASPVFLDVDKDTMGMSPSALANWLDEHAEVRESGTFNKQTGARIAACLPMHTFGFMCRIDRILNVCKTWGIPVIEDAAEALGSAYKGRLAGSWGVMGALSFNGNKLVTSGGGGAIVSFDKVWAEKAKYLTTTAKRPHKYEYFHDELGYNFRMPNLNAALLSGQLEQMNGFIENKKELYTHYESIFSNECVDLTPIPSHTTWNYWLMSVITNSKDERQKFLEKTNENGIMTRPIWQLMHKLPMYKHCQRDDQKNAEYLEERVVNIPSGVRLYEK